MANLKLTILAPERRLAEGVEVEEVTINGSEGQIQLLPGHAPMIGTLEAGMFSFKHPGGSLTSGVISGGFFEIAKDEVTVTADSLELVGEIDLMRAKQAQQEAEQVLREADLDEHKFKEYQAQLEHALVLQQAATNHTLH